MHCRMAREDERDMLRALWKTTFKDEDRFTDWFFSERFLPDYCAVTEQDGLIAACAHALPASIRIRDAVLPCAILGGVATDARFRKQGMMHRTMTYLMNALRSGGVALTPHRPAALPTFFSLGHYPVCDMQYAKRTPGYAGALKGGMACRPLPAAASALYACYGRFSLRYSGIIQRSWADFMLKLRDYASCGAYVLADTGMDALDGYLVFFDNAEEGLFCDECVALTDAAYQRLFDALCALYPGRDILLRMAPDAPALNGASSVTEPRGVLGVCNAQALLKAVSVRGAVLCVTDGVIKENNGVFTSDGLETDAPPDITIEAGRLAQWAAGYLSMRELAAQGYAQAHNASAVQTMDSAGKYPCYIIDEY